MAHQIPASNARDIFVSAEDFRLTYERLTLLPASEPDTIRTLGPQVVCAAFAVELYLKCILVDAGLKTLPNKHNLAFLYQQIPKTTRCLVVRKWRTLLKQWKSVDASVDTASKLESVLANIGYAFENWRYRYEPTTTDLASDRFTLVHASLHGYITGKHPDWLDEGHSYFLSTFPVP